ncbi:MAG: hypothetical protein V2J42_08190 [Wenzhouxiangella sp.]|jgi:hypothetical protein|nr:hypothetical protein [Wenzhouxiangella sp.]
MNSWAQYIAIARRCKWVLASLGFVASCAGAASLLELESGPGRLGPVSWDGAELQRRLGQSESSGLEIQLFGLRLLKSLPPGDLSLSCRHWVVAPERGRCTGGRLIAPEDWLALEGEMELEGSASDDTGHRLRLEHPQLALTLDWSPEIGLDIKLDRLDLAVLGPVLESRLALGTVGGSVSGSVRADRQGLRAELVTEGAFFDTPDGRFAGDGLDLALGLVTTAESEDLNLSVRQTAGELLLDTVYLPPPDQAIELEATLGLTVPGRMNIEGLRLEDPGSLSLRGSAELAAGESGWALQRLVIEALDARLSELWPRWLEGPAAAAGFPDFSARGQISGTLDWRVDGEARVDLQAEGLSLEDPRERAGVRGLNAELSGTDEALRVGLAWEALNLLGLPLGAGRARLHRDEVGLRLLDPVRVALFDGALVIDGLALLEPPALESKLVLDARIEPLDLARLTRALGLPELGGQLAGSFPGVTYRDQRLAFTGGIQIDAFSGRIDVQDLVIERVFGSAPALTAQIELERLDLLELTGAFGFGRMEGQASGWIRDLRLLSWRPVAMDARFFTHEDAPRRRISQRAVDNLSSLGGGGSAVISGTILRLFEDFPYQRAGLACRLANNICQLDGVARHESGGFLIVEGRGLPRLDIVGHRRLVDWPQLINQLAGMIERGSAQSGEGQGSAAP